MAYSNTSRPNGFKPSEESVGAAHVVLRPIPNTRHASSGGNASTDLACGDAYALDSSGNAYRAGPSDIVRGIVIGFVFQANPAVMNANGPLSVDYITGAPATGSWPNLIGIEDNKTIFEVGSDTFAVNDSLGSVNLADAAPDPLFRISQQTVSISGGAGNQFKLIGLKNSPVDNAVGAYARVLVQMLQATP
jgi:hypothetical protein